MVARCKIIIVAVSGALCFLLTGCSRSKSSTEPVRIAAPGVVLVDVLRGGFPEHYWQYEIRPESGSVHSVREETFQDPSEEDLPTSYQKPAGAFGTCATNPRAVSPDGRYVAYCGDDGPEQFYIVDSTSNKEIQEWKAGERGIRGFAWGPNSRWVAILNRSSHLGYGPLELLSALSGHTVPHDDIFLTFLDIDTGKVTEYVIRKDVISSFTRILKWAR